MFKRNRKKIIAGLGVISLLASLLGAPVAGVVSVLSRTAAMELEQLDE